MQLNCISAVKFIAHLVNQQVAHELLALEILVRGCVVSWCMFHRCLLMSIAGRIPQSLLLDKPSDDSVEVAVDFVKECGHTLSSVSPQGLHGGSCRTARVDSPRNRD